MHLLIGAGCLNEGAEERGAHALSLRGGREIDGGLIAAGPHPRIAVRVIERPAQVITGIRLRNKARAVLLPDVAQVVFALCDAGGARAENDVCVLDSPVEGIRHGGHIC